MFKDKLRSCVLSNAWVMTRQGEISAADLKVADHVLSYHSGFVPIERLSTWYVNDLEVVSVRPEHLANHRNMTVPAVQRIRCDTESPTLDCAKKMVLARAAHLTDGEVFTQRRIGKSCLVEIHLAEPAIIWVCGGMVELVDPDRHKGKTFGRGKQPTSLQGKYSISFMCDVS